MLNVAKTLLELGFVSHNEVIVKVLAECAYFKKVDPKKDSLVVQFRKNARRRYARFLSDFYLASPFNSINFCYLLEEYNPQGDSVGERCNDVKTNILHADLQDQFFTHGVMSNKAYLMCAKKPLVCPNGVKVNINVYAFLNKDDYTDLLLEKFLVPAIRDASLSLPSMFLT